jgi:hypothetical protein
METGGTLVDCAQRAAARLVAAACTAPPPLDPLTWAYVSTFTALVLPVGLATGVLRFKIERRPAKWLEVDRRSHHDISHGLRSWLHAAIMAPLRTRL